MESSQNLNSSWGEKWQNMRRQVFSWITTQPFTITPATVISVTNLSLVYTTMFSWFVIKIWVDIIRIMMIHVKNVNYAINFLKRFPVTQSIIPKITELFRAFLIISGGGIETVSRITKTLVITARVGCAGSGTENKYRKSDGYPPGEYYYHFKSARLPRNDSEIGELIEARRVSVMVNRLDAYNFKQLPAEDLESIIGIIKARVTND